MISYSSRLREELSCRALSWAKNNDLPHECTIGNLPSVLFREADDNKHGNFHPASYKCIRRKPEWNRRLRKPHTSARRNLPSHDAHRSELDTAASSLRLLLATEAPERLQFGWKPRIPLLANHVERTEIDLRIGDLFIEAKLTEVDFPPAPRVRVERYRDLSCVFDTKLLPRIAESYLHYQLIRGVLSVFAEEGIRYCVICDARRPDLIDAWFSVASAVRIPLLRSRLQLTTWQEIAATLPKSMRVWLEDKYGIEGNRT
jgi:hypothetical protein